MTPQLKSLNTGILKCAQSKFLQNFENPNKIIQGCNLILVIPAQDQSMLEENFRTAYDVPFTSYAVRPAGEGKVAFYCAVDFSSYETIDVWANTFVLVNAHGVVEVYYVGRNETPSAAIDQGLNDSLPNHIYLMTPIVSTRKHVCFSQVYYPDYPDERKGFDAFTLIAADCTFLEGNIQVGRRAGLIVNSQLTLPEAGAIVCADYTEVEYLPDVYLAPQEHPENIVEGAFIYNINNLVYHGEWNETTRKWFNGSIYFLNGEPLDPIPNE